MAWYCLFVTLTLSLASAAWAADLPSIKLGLVIPRAEEAGRVSESMRQAAEMAIADRGERLGRRIDLAVEEDQFDPKQAVVVAEKLVHEGVWGVIGHFYSSSSIPASAIYHRAGVPQITPTSTNPRLTTQGFDTVFRVSGRDDQQALSAAQFILTHLRARRIAVIHDRTEYGRTLAETLVTAMGRRTARGIVGVEAIVQGDKDFGRQVAWLKSVNPDVVYFGGIFREGGYLIRQVRQAKLSASFVSGDGVLDPEFVKIAGEEAATGVYLTFAPDPRLVASARAFIQRFEARHGPMGAYVPYTYDATGVLLRAIREAKPLSSAKRELAKVLKVLHGMTYDGTLGRLRWDRNGDLVTSPYVVYVTRKGGGLHGWFEQVTGLPSDRNSTRGSRR